MARGSPAAARSCPRTVHGGPWRGYLQTALHGRYAAGTGVSMTTARDIMTGPAECARTSDTVAGAARRMRDLDAISSKPPNS